MPTLLSLRSPVAGLAIAAASVAFAQAPPDGDAARGQKMFAAHCASCHGDAGKGGRGPNLATPALKHGTSLEAIAEIVQQGIPGTEMPGSWMISAKDAVDIATFVRSLSAVAPETLSGDAGSGRALFEGKGACAACHIVKGKGSAYGPELSVVGAQRNAAYLRQAIVDPAAQVAPDYLVVEATPRAAKPIRGMRINEDSFTIQIRDLAGGLHSLDKQNLSGLKKLGKESAMPSYQGRLSSAEVEDLVAYLASLR